MSLTEIVHENDNDLGLCPMAGFELVVLNFCALLSYEGVYRSFRTGRLE
jgi:hypothetical protein